MSDQADKTKETAFTAVVANVKRLLNDARCWQASGSAGSALSLAILAFEEAGKGHIIENGWVKPKHARSQHSYRHFMAFMVLQASFTQKYELDMPRRAEQDRCPVRSPRPQARQHGTPAADEPGTTRSAAR